MLEEQNILPRADSPRIMVVDDDPITLSLLSGIASSLHWNSLLCRCSEDAEEEICGPLAGPAPDIILLDIHLGNKSGIDLCKKIRSLGDPAHLPFSWIIGFTSDTSLATIQKLLAAGGNDYIVKPASPEEIKIKLEVARFGHARHRAFKKRMALLEEELSRSKT